MPELRISCDICMSRLMRSSVGGCVENSFKNPRAENELAIIMDDTDCVPAVFGIGLV